jgi:GT2 family glycosyltransferase
MSDLGASIVIPTFNRQARLGRVLSALKEQSVAPSRFEVVVVDDGSRDGTSEWLRAQSFPFALRVVRQENAGPARARNTGIEAAERPLLLFIDDDVVPSPELVGEHLRCHELEQDVVVIGPLGTLPHYAQPWVAWEQERIDRQYRDMAEGAWAPTFRQFWTGNASVAREHVRAVGGFDNDFLRGEDVELGSRLHLRGLKFRFNPAAKSLHYAERSLESWVNAHRSYGALEVKIFGRFGDDELDDVLSKNWSRLHKVTRLVVKRCATQRAAYDAMKWALVQALELEARAPRPVLSNKLCSVLANVAYWQASAEALGGPRAERIFERGERIRQGRA